MRVNKVSAAAAAAAAHASAYNHDGAKVYARTVH